MERTARRLLLACLACVALLALAVRDVCDLRHPYAPHEPQQGWFTLDPDSHYHMRRVARALDEGLPPAETDARMDFPNGAAIPWPPYYTYVLYAAVAPFAPDEPAARARFVEQRVASLPCVFAAVTSVLLALGAWRLTRERPEGVRMLAAALAGGTYALLGASLEYSAVGNGDHHAWVVMLLAALAFAGGAALRDEALAHRAGSARRGALLGLLAAALVGSWVGGLVYVALLELALGLALFAHARRARPGLPALGLAFHLAWAAGLAPAVLSSPWKDAQPWMLVNLSWLHLAHPLLGAVLFAPLSLDSRDALRARWPWLVSAALALLCASIAFGDFALARGVRDGFAWAGRSNEFMAFIAESQPLAWGQIGGLGPFVAALGWGALLAPLAFAALAWSALRERRLELAPLCVLFPALLAQALLQRRFADAFGVPLSLALALGVAGWLPRAWSPTAGLGSALGLTLALLSSAPTLSTAFARAEHPWDARDEGPALDRRALYARLRELPGEDEAVLASWDNGHALEWVAGRPTVATNFGSYVGRDSYLDPWRFFLEDDPVAAEQLLERRRARYVLLRGDFSKDLEVMLRLLRPETRRSYLLIPKDGPVFTSQRFFTTQAARLMMNGRVGDLEQRQLVGDSLDYLRLVHVSKGVLPEPPPIRHTNAPVPAGWIWERVPGARLELGGEPGERATVALDVEYRSAGQRLTWIGSATVGADRVARVRMPYSTDAANGDGVAAGPARCTVGARSFPLPVREADVLAGATLRAP